MSRRRVSQDIIEFDAASGLPTFGEMGMNPGEIAHNMETDVFYTWDGTQWVQGMTLDKTLKPAVDFSYSVATDVAGLVTDFNALLDVLATQEIVTIT